MAERVGFEPTRGGRPLRAFQARLFGHSSTSPRRGWDSNPRPLLRDSAFRERCLNPLGHLSNEWNYIITIIYLGGA